MDALAYRLSNNLRDTQYSETLLANQICNDRLKQGQTVYQFGFGQSPFPVPEHIVTALREAAHRKEYIEVQGLLALRQAVAAFHSRQGAPWHADRVVIGAGSKILLYCVMAAIETADIALVSPSWVSYEPQAQLAGHRVFRLETTFDQRWRLLPEALERFCMARADTERPLVLILNYPGNPDGLSYTSQELAALAEVLRRHHVIVVSDEIYGLLHHQGSHGSLADYYPEGTIVTTGLSKWCGAGGWRLGVMHVPWQLGEQYFQRIIGVCSETYSCASAPIQHAAVSAYSMNAAAERFLQHQRGTLAELGGWCALRLQEAGVLVHPPEGGYYLFPDFEDHRVALASRGISTSRQLTQTLLEQTGVSLLPGSALGMPEISLTARLAYVDFDGGSGLIAGQCDTGRVEAGVRALCRWLQGLY